MSKDSFPSKVFNRAGLKKTVAQRPRKIIIASGFNAWTDPEDYYCFRAPDKRGVHKCGQVFHPGASLLEGYEDLCDRVLWGCEVVLELRPDRQSAIRFAEMLLARLYHEMEARKTLVNPYAKDLVFNSDWSARDGLGPCSIPVPAVIGYTEPTNLRQHLTDKPAVIWSRYWQLESDVVPELIAHVRQKLLAYNQSLKKRTGPKLKIPAMEMWIAEALADLCVQAGGATHVKKKPLNIQNTLKWPPLPFKKRIAEEQIEEICLMLERRIRESGIQRDWANMMRAPAASMYENAGSSFENRDGVMVDCWGYPFGFDLFFGRGVVKIRGEEMAGLNMPSADIIAKPTTPLQLPSAGNPDEWLTISQAAKYVGKTTRTIGAWLKKKTDDGQPMLPNVFRSGRTIRIRCRDLDPFRKKR